METRRRVLNFDLNGTIIAHDSTDTIPLESQSNERISKSKTGHVVIEGDEFKWISCMETIKRVPIETLSYHAFVKKYYKESYEELSRTFTNKGNPGEKFRKQYLITLKYIMDTKIFPSFINALKTIGINDCVVLRTFGEDGIDVVERTNAFVAKSFVFGTLMYDEDDKVILDMNGTIYSGHDEITNYFNTCKFNLCIRDSYSRWKNNSKKAEFGKPMFCHKEYDSYFFDDNPCVYPTYYSDNNGIYIVNTLDALFDNDYFTKKLMK